MNDVGIGRLYPETYTGDLGSRLTDPGVGLSAQLSKSVRDCYHRGLMAGMGCVWAPPMKSRPIYVFAVRLVGNRGERACIYPVTHFGGG